MPTNTVKDLRTKAYVLRRTNYGEADRILNLLTPTGKISAMARGVRKEKSKLAGGIEMFCLIDINIHQGKNDFGVVTSSKMLKYYSNLVIDLSRMELASLALKKIAQIAENSDSPDFFNILDQVLAGLDAKYDLETVETWFWFNYAKASGEEINLYRDTKGEKLREDETYVWDSLEAALKPQLGGNIGKNEIKLMRLMLNTKLELVCRIKNIQDKIPSVLYIAKSVAKA